MSRRDQLEEMLKVEPRDVFLNYALAKAFTEEGRPAEGIAQFRKTLEIDPDHVPSYFQLAQTLAAEADIDDARETTERGIAVARKVGDDHAEMEMREFLETL